jgi:capsular polysaccharide export protein
MKGHRFLALSAARRCGHIPLYLEEAPLPGRVTVDFHGINYGSSLPRSPKFYLKWLEGNPHIDPNAWRSMRGQLTAGLAKQTQTTGGGSGSESLPQGKYIFCPLQMPGDSQITVYGDWLRSIEDLVKHLEGAAALPDGWRLIIKEHPRTRVSLAAKLASLATKRIVLDNVTDTMGLIADAEAVVTINSSVGFESFFFDKPVIVLGHAFYDFHPLATKVGSGAELKALFKKPDTLTFDTPTRNAFMSYVTEQHFPREDDIVAGKLTLDDIIKRDIACAELLLQLEDA